ncbi:hypothetical protein J6590_015020 [Homalodisca vitripennis]|nr:hypothetical protein J6590_015020 [Homalodisca vitripennis]
MELPPGLVISKVKCAGRAKQENNKTCGLALIAILHLLLVKTSLERYSLVVRVENTFNTKVAQLSPSANFQIKLDKSVNSYLNIHQRFSNVLISITFPRCNDPFVINVTSFKNRTFTENHLKNSKTHDMDIKLTGYYHMASYEPRPSDNKTLNCVRHTHRGNEEQLFVFSAVKVISNEKYNQAGGMFGLQFIISDMLERSSKFMTELVISDAGRDEVTCPLKWISISQT